MGWGGMGSGGECCGMCGRVRSEVRLGMECGGVRGEVRWGVLGMWSGVWVGYMVVWGRLGFGSAVE